jgi:hypothetical protein
MPKYNEDKIQNGGTKLLSHAKPTQTNSKKHLRFSLTLNVQASQLYTTKNIHLEYTRERELCLNVGFVSRKDERDFKTTAKGLIEEKARLESGNEWKP